MIYSYRAEKTHKEQYAWNAKVESEDEYTQMILLTWVRYDEYIQQTMLISAMWNYQIDFNLIYSLLVHTQGKIDLIIAYLPMFETWKLQPNNIKKYENKKKEFIERRCCNHQINLLCIFIIEKKILRCNPIELAASVTVNSGLPFVKKNYNKNL
ncbi:hypothetical protein RFI_35226 [Reticulomyxa filosa]|uniref:Uncharacterized protein n=1 Tax=Reticulomyxa filosa TaxID=46433 RepID=X6LNA4_RETFI|nr:hypothetical protein RFI_35226 [Reticulomyxa filosa]|eukprot:ETO02210.1 hypothetical protein RFI_35226 [Reticulomyxa filosa]